MNSGETIEFALDALRRGHIVGLPTDTVYGIGANPFSEDAVRALFLAKGRPAVKPIPILAADIDTLRLVAILEDEAVSAAERHWPGGLTLILRRVLGLPPWVGDPDAGTIGVRIPAHDTALALLRGAGPLAVTSANRSGDPPALDDREARAALGEAVSVYLAGRSGGGAPSTVVDLTGPEARVLRSGPISWSGERIANSE